MGGHRMDDIHLHHVSLTTRDLARSTAFFTEVLGFTQIPRPDFSVPGAWVKAGQVELHLIDFPQGSFRNTRSVGTDDIHFALRVTDFEGWIARLQQHGYRDDLDDADNKRLIIKRKSMAGYSQLYLMDPDCHLIEINAAFVGS
jgi:catechol 2,3-dioxygenase-like lactoylglutathione lyase family enzyme